MHVEVIFILDDVLYLIYVTTIVVDDK